MTFFMWITTEGPLCFRWPLNQKPTDFMFVHCEGSHTSPSEPPEKEVSVIPASGHSICNPIRCRSCVMNGYLWPQLRAVTTDWRLSFGNKRQGLRANDMLWRANLNLAWRSCVHPDEIVLSGCICKHSVTRPTPMRARHGAIRTLQRCF